MYLILSYLILSYLILSYPIVSYPILSCPILSYPILSYPILSYLFFSFLIVLHKIFPSYHLILSHLIIFCINYPQNMPYVPQLLPLFPSFSPSLNLSSRLPPSFHNLGAFQCSPGPVWGILELQILWCSCFSQLILMMIRQGQRWG